MSKEIELSEEEVRLLKAALITWRNSRIEDIISDGKIKYSELPQSLKDSINEETFIQSFISNAISGHGYLGNMGFDHFNQIAKEIYNKLND